MNNERLNEHDANQGAQSQGEFLGMTGNSGWYLLGAAGASIIIVILFWGIFGVPLLPCLMLGAVLCALSLAYVFTLKNNKPEHYDTDFFESALIDSGLLTLAFGPREKRPRNPFRSAAILSEVEPSLAKDDRRRTTPASHRTVAPATPAREGRKDAAAAPSTSLRPREEVRTVPLADFERLRDELNVAEESLEDALTTREEEGVCE